MENAFFEFLETYWADIAAFVKAFVEFVESIIGKTQDAE